MPEKVKWSTSVEVQNGPLFNFSSIVPADAYEKIQVEVKPGGDGTKVNILPTDVDAKFLLIKASKYVDAADATQKLSYAVGEESEKDLSGPLVMTDANVLSLLGEDLTEVTFKNSMADPVIVDILVCRDAGPSA